MLVKFAVACAKCCAWYLEKVVTYINRNAFIVVAIKGSAFCPSAARAVKLIVTNALRLLAVNSVGDVLMWLGKVVTALSGCIVAFAISESSFYSDPGSKYYLSTPLLPIGLSTIMAYAIGELFFNVYEMARGEKGWRGSHTALRCHGAQGCTCAWVLDLSLLTRGVSPAGCGHDYAFLLRRLRPARR